MGTMKKLFIITVLGMLLAITQYIAVMKFIAAFASPVNDPVLQIILFLESVFAFGIAYRCYKELLPYFPPRKTRMK